MRIVCKSTLLPPLQSPPDGDSYYELGRKELVQAVEIKPLQFEDLVEDALKKIDRPKPVPDFPFGWKDGDKTWRELIQSGDETHPVWVEALRRTTEPKNGNPR